MTVDPCLELRSSERRRLARVANQSPFSPEQVAELVRYPEMLPLLACNPNLPEPGLEQLVADLLARSALDTSCYDSLGILASAGRLAAFPGALWQLLERIKPVHSYIQSLNPHRGLAPRVVLRCPVLEPATLIALDRRLVTAGLVAGRDRVAQHPCANGAVWMAMLRHLPSPDIVHLIWETPEADEDPAVRHFLRERRGLAAPEVARFEERRPTAEAVAPRRRPKRGCSAHGLRFADVVAAFVQAERELGTEWKLSGRGYCRRVVLDARYSRVVTPAIRSWVRISPSGAPSRRTLFPLRLVERAAEILGVEVGLLAQAEY